MAVSDSDVQQIVTLAQALVAAHDAALQARADAEAAQAQADQADAQAAQKKLAAASAGGQEHGAVVAIQAFVAGLDQQPPPTQPPAGP